MNYKNTHNTAAGVLEFEALLHIVSNEMLSYRVGRDLFAVKLANVRATRNHVFTGRCGYKVNGLTGVDVQYAEMPDVQTFLWPLSP